MNAQSTANVILRIGVAFAFLYAALNGFLDPYSWIDYFPQFMSGADPVLLLRAWGVVEILLALWILSGKKILVPSVIAAALLCAIVAFNMAQFQLLFRDLSIAAAALALAALNVKDTRGPNKTAPLP